MHSVEGQHFELFLKMFVMDETTMKRDPSSSNKINETFIDFSFHYLTKGIPNPFLCLRQLINFDFFPLRLPVQNNKKYSMFKI